MLFNFFKNRKISKEFSENMYFNLLLEKIGNLYDIKGDIATQSAHILQMAYINGHCGCAKLKDGKYYVGIGSFTGNIMPNGLMKEYTISYPNGEIINGEVGKDIAIFNWYNTYRSNLLFEKTTSNLLTETDISIKYLIMNSRLCPIPIVENDTEEKSIKEVLKKMYDGVPLVFKRRQKSDIFEQVQNVKQTLDITQPNAMIYLQNLSRFRDELIIRWCMEHGIVVTSRDKGAQLNESELNAFADYSAISADDTYNNLLRFASDCKNIFNIDVEVSRKNFTNTNDSVVTKEDKEVDNNDN